MIANTRDRASEKARPKKCVPTKKSTMTKSTNQGAKNRIEFKLLPALLKTESKADFARLLDALERDVEPTTFIESMYVHEIAGLIWDIIRYRRSKAGIVSNTFRTALENTLRLILPAGTPSSITLLEKFSSKAKELSNEWFCLRETKDKVSALLKEAGLDIHAVEAEALRMALPDVEKIDRLLAAAEARRDRAFRSIDWYRECFVEKLRQSSDQLLAADGLSGLGTPGSVN